MAAQTHLKYYFRCVCAALTPAAEPRDGSAHPEFDCAIAHLARATTQPASGRLTAKRAAKR